MMDLGLFSVLGLLALETGLMDRHRQRRGGGGASAARRRRSSACGSRHQAEAEAARPRRDGSRRWPVPARDRSSAAAGRPAARAPASEADGMHDTEQTLRFERGESRAK